jgi:hypothetical protein
MPPRAPAFSRNVRFVQGDVAGHGAAALDACSPSRWRSSMWWSGGRGATAPSGGDRSRRIPLRKLIERHRAELRVWDEDAFLAAVHAIPALADSASPSWEQEECDNAYRLLAAADVIGSGGWVTAVVPVFERVARGTCTRPCRRFVMVPSGPLRLPRCWSRWPAIPALALVSGRCGSWGSCGGGPASDHSSTRPTMARTGPCRGQTLAGDARPGGSRRRRCGGWSAGAALRRCCLAR